MSNIKPLDAKIMQTSEGATFINLTQVREIELYLVPLLFTDDVLSPEEIRLHALGWWKDYFEHFRDLPFDEWLDDEMRDNT